MIEADADGAAGPQCIVVTPTRFLSEDHLIKHISWELYLFHGSILEPMCENSSGYLDDGEALISIYPKPGTALVLELFSHDMKTIFCVKLRHVSDFLCFQGACHPNPQRGQEVRPRLNDQECGGIWRDQCFLSG